MNLVLIGYRGCGKSRVGARLAERLGMPCVDTDALIEARAGTSIRQIFTERGEAAFRDLESQIVEEVSRGDDQIISAGGGVILRDANVTALKRNGKLVWLTAPPEVLWSRIQADMQSESTRPNLTSSGGLEEVQEVLARRTPLYARAADFQIDTSATDAAEVTEKIARWWVSLSSNSAG